jgi:hypothetical protein
MWFSRSHNLNERIAFGVAVVWLVAGQCHAMFARRARILPADAGLSTSLAFLRQELQRKRDFLRLVWLRFLGPAFLVLGVFLVPKLGANFKYWTKALPFFSLLAAWFVAYYFQRRGKRKELRKELQQLEALEREAAGR